eukprot:2050020-Rhodomonas_salina.1
MQEAGAPAHLELGFTIADGIEYVRCGTAAGYAPTLSCVQQIARWIRCVCVGHSSLGLCACA